jgi:hypothetical protein
VTTGGKILIVLGLVLGLASLAVSNERGIMAGVVMVGVGILLLIEFRGT